MPFGVGVITDQQLAGLSMWIPMALVLFGVSLGLFSLALAVFAPRNPPNDFRPPPIGYSNHPKSLNFRIGVRT
jgi:hypothetical protein